MVQVKCKDLRQIADNVIDLLLKKNHDYGDAWQRHDIVGILARLSDKSLRLETLLGSSALVVNEKWEDTLRDIAGYSLLGLLLDTHEHPQRPVIVCLCGSTRFSDAFRDANLRETLAGKIVLSIGCDFKSDDTLGLEPDTKERLDELHLRKIDLADEALILNVDGYIGESTGKELEYARLQGKKVRFLEPVA